MNYDNDDDQEINQNGVLNFSDLSSISDNYEVK